MNTAAFVDFKTVKEATPIEKAVPLLGLSMKQNGDQWRSACPACKQGGERALAVNITKGSFYCFADKKGGDVISFAAHIRGDSMRDAALFLSGGGTPSTASPSPARAPGPTVQTEKRELQPLGYLEAAHEHVQALGVSPETARAWGAGFAPKGIMRGRFAVPIHGKDGVLLAYVGVAVGKEQSPKLLYSRPLYRSRRNRKSWILPHDCSPA